MNDTFDVYVVDKGKRPRKVGEAEGKIAGSITVDGLTYYWVGADLTERTLTYADAKPANLAANN